MSNRTDFDALAEELLEQFDCMTEDGSGRDARQERLEAELHNAFVAGQESERGALRNLADTVEIWASGSYGHDDLLRAFRAYKAT